MHKIKKNLDVLKKTTRDVGNWPDFIFPIKKKKYIFTQIAKIFSSPSNISDEVNFTKIPVMMASQIYKNCVKFVQIENL